MQSDEEPLSSSDEREERLEPVKEAAPVTTRWSRWFTRSRTIRETISESTTPHESGPSARPGLVPTSSAPNAVVSNSRDHPSIFAHGKQESVARASSPDLKSPPTPEQPVSGPASIPTRHYVKTLRLTSEQLVSETTLDHKLCLTSL